MNSLVTYTDLHISNNSIEQLRNHMDQAKCEGTVNNSCSTIISLLYKIFIDEV